MAKIHLGCAMWTLPHWRRVFFPASLPAAEHLAYYSQYYSSVEGNSTFYALPEQKTVQKWSDSVTAGFKFCFKLPREITHDNQLHACQSQMQNYLERLAPMLEKQQIGRIFIQLPPAFNGQKLAILEAFINHYKDHLPLSVEVRHPDFFNKGDSERALNRLLIEQKVDRVMIDTRPVHLEVADNPATIDAQKKKPKLPVHVLATGQNPVVRYIGQMQTEQNIPFIKPWLPHFKNWLAQGRQPFLFIHSADNANVHALAALWQKLLHSELGEAPFKHDFSQITANAQNSLF